MGGFDRSDYQVYLERQPRHKEAERRRREHLQSTRMGAVAGELLTNHPAWDPFIQLLQGRIDEQNQHLEGYRETLLSAGTLGHQEIIALKLKIAEFQASNQALQWAIERPKALIDDWKDIKVDAVEVEIEVEN